MGCLNMMLCSFISKWMMHSGAVFVSLSLYCEITNLSDFYLGINSCFGLKEMWCIRHWRLSVANLPCSLLVTLRFRLSGENPVVAAFWFLKLTCALHAVEQVSAWGSSSTGSLCQLSDSSCSCFGVLLLQLMGPGCLSGAPNSAPFSQLLMRSPFGCPWLLFLSHFVWQPLSKFCCL